MIIDGIGLVEIPTHPGYFVSKCGKIWSSPKLSNANKSGKWIKLQVDNFGYYRVRLYKNGIPSTQKVHRLVAMTYIDNYVGFPEVNHIDENKLNNNVCNLEWVTSKQNIRHSAYKHSKFYAFLNNLGEVCTGYDLTRFCKENGLSQAHMQKVLRGKRKSHKGYTCPKLNVIGA